MKKHIPVAFTLLTTLSCTSIVYLSTSCNFKPKEYKYFIELDKFSATIDENNPSVILNASLKDTNGQYLLSSEKVTWVFDSRLNNSSWVRISTHDNTVSFELKDDVDRVANTYEIIATYNQAQKAKFTLSTNDYTAPAYGAHLEITSSPSNATLNQSNSSVAFTATVDRGTQSPITWNINDNGSHQSNINYPQTLTGVSTISFSLTTGEDVEPQVITVSASMTDAATQRVTLNIEKFIKPEVWNPTWIPYEKLTINRGVLTGLTNDFSLSVNSPSDNLNNQQQGYDTLHIPREVTSIAKGAFSFSKDNWFSSGPKLASNITKLDWGASQIATIGEWCFHNAPFSGALVLPSTLTTVSQSTFMSCGLLTSLDLSQTQLTKIPSVCFGNNSAMTKITWNTKIKTIDQESFRGWVNFNDDLVLPNSVENIKPQAFLSLGAASQKKIKLTWPTNLKSIDYYAFLGSYIDSDNILNQLDVVSIPSTITIVPEGLFDSNKCIKTINVHAQVTSVGDMAFASNKVLERINLYPDKVIPYFHNQPVSMTGLLAYCTKFQGTYDSSSHNGQVFVPSNRINDYKMSSSWSSIDPSHFFAL